MLPECDCLADTEEFSVWPTSLCQAALTNTSANITKAFSKQTVTPSARWVTNSVARWVVCLQRLKVVLIVSQKNMPLNIRSYLWEILTNFGNSFTARLSSQQYNETVNHILNLWNTKVQT